MDFNYLQGSFVSAGRISLSVWESSSAHMNSVFAFLGIALFCSSGLKESFFVGFSVGSFIFVAPGSLNTPIAVFVVLASSLGSSEKLD